MATHQLARGRCLASYRLKASTRSSLEGSSTGRCAWLLLLVVVVSSGISSFARLHAPSTARFPPSPMFIVAFSSGMCVHVS